jgi:signal transduction histidine kinase
MRATAWLRHNTLEVAWAVFALANLAVMRMWPDAVRLPFFLIWIGLTFVYGFREWSRAATAAVLTVVSAGILAVVWADGFSGDELWGKLVAVPCLAAMFAAVAWHSHRRTNALRAVETVAETRASLLERQRQFLYDASHELRTPVTIARGHLELLQWTEPDSPELGVALDELGRMERILERLLLLARAEQPDFLVRTEVDLERFLEEVFLRWAEVAERGWRLEVDVVGVVRVDPEGLRSALDALLENAVKYTEPRAAITLGAWAAGGEIVIEVADDGCGIAADSTEWIFDRWARADTARTREHGGAGLGLALVSAVARAHGGSCSVARRPRGTAFTLHLPVASEPAVSPVAAPGQETEAGAALGIVGS